MFWEGGTRKEPLLSLVEASGTVGVTSAGHQLSLPGLHTQQEPQQEAFGSLFARRFAEPRTSCDQPAGPFLLYFVQ